MADLLNGLGGPAGFGTEFLPDGLDSVETFNIADDFGQQLEYGVDDLFTNIQVSNNGFIIFGGVGFSGFQEGDLDTFTVLEVIAPLFGDATTGAPAGDPFTPTPGGNSTGANRVWISQQTDQFVITWDDVAHEDPTVLGFVGQSLNAYQVILTDASEDAGRSVGDFDIEFRYEAVNWNTGDQDGLADGNDVIAVAGLTTGNGVSDTSFELPGSGTADGILNLATALGNTGEAGRWLFEVRDGVITVPGGGVFLSVEVDSTTTLEGDEDTLTFTVTRSGDISGALDVDFEIAGSGANPASNDDIDGVFPSGTINFLANETTQTITVTVDDDEAPETDETFTFTLDPLSAVTGNVTITTGTATVTITDDDQGNNTAPVGQDDAFTALQGGNANGNVLADNGSGVDSDADGNPLTVSAVNGQAANVGNAVVLTNGTVTVQADGTLNYTSTGATGSDTFTYTVSDGVGGTDTASVTITIDPATGQPVAQNDAFNIGENQIINGATSLFADNGNGADIDPDGDPFVVSAVNGNGANVGNQFALASGALLTVNANGTFTYNPNGAFSALGDGQTDTDSFTYTIDDVVDGTDTATVNITVNGSDATTIGIAGLFTNLTEGSFTGIPQTFTVSRSGDTASTMTVDFAVTGSGTNPVDADDFGGVLPTGTVTFLPGVSTVAFDIPVNGDFRFEPDEEFTVTISNPTTTGDPVTLTTTTTTAMIINDDVDITNPGTEDKDRLRGTEAVEVFDGLGGRDRADGEGGNDILFGGGDRDKLNGDEGDDAIFGEADRDRISGGEGNDILDGGTEDDRIDGDEGDDIINGGAGDDRLRGDDGDDIINAGAGDDRARGDDGNDDINGDAGNDRLDGRDGDDNLNGGAGDDDIRAGDGDDVIDGGAGNDEIRAGDGTDNIDGGEGDDEIRGDDGEDFIQGGAGNDDIRAGDDNDMVFGGSGDDVIDGDKGDDMIFGGEGNDVIEGDRGADIIEGGLGDDIMDGGRDADTFVISPNEGDDLITDFDEDEDFLDFTGFGDTLDFDTFIANAQDTDDGVVYTDATFGNTITLEKVEIEDLSADNFLFA